MHAKSFQCCLTLCDPKDCSLPGSSVRGIIQARILEWVATPSSRGSSLPDDQTHIFCISHFSGRFFARATGEAQVVERGVCVNQTQRQERFPSCQGGLDSAPRIPNINYSALCLNLLLPPSPILNPFLPPKPSGNSPGERECLEIPAFPFFDYSLRDSNWKPVVSDRPHTMLCGLPFVGISKQKKHAIHLVSFGNRTTD